APLAAVPTAGRMRRMLIRPLRPAVAVLAVAAAAPLGAQQKPAAAPPAAAPLPAPKIFGTPVRMFGGLPIGAAFTRDGALLLTSSMGSAAQVWDPRTGRRLAHSAGKGFAGDACFCGP